MRHIPSLVAFAVLAIIGSEAQVIEESPQCKNACNPPIGKPCAVGDRIALKLGIQDDLAFGLCPTVDKLTGIKLKVTKGDSITENLTLKIDGFVTPAASNETNNMSLVPAALTQITEYVDDTLYLADLIFINITLSKGVFNRNPGNETYEWDGAGFRPTCDENDQCLHADDGSERKCIGSVPGKKSCAKKIGNPLSAKDHFTQVMVFYYGKDKDGNLMESGNLNPFELSGFGRGSFSPFTAITSSF